MAEETAEVRRKRLTMRAWRRGTKEMDLILGPWAEAHLDGLAPDRLALFERLLEENDQDLMAWIFGQAPAPEALAGFLAEIAGFARTRLSSGGGARGI
jgi:antitoxin CptB